MNAAFFPAVALAATVLLLPKPGQAQTFTDNAGNYTNSYADQGGSTPGFGPFHVATTTKAGGAAGTFLFSAAISENNQGIAGDTPSTLDTPATPSSKQPQAFGCFANGPGQGLEDPSVTVTRAFNVPAESSGLATAGDTFALDFVTGYNDGGTSGVALTTSGGPVGSFLYQTGDRFLFNGIATGQTYHRGVLHLRYTLTSPITYSFGCTGAVTFSGTGTFAGPITGFQVRQTNSNGPGPDHNAFFNNLVLTCVPKTP